MDDLIKIMNDFDRVALLEHAAYEFEHRMAINECAASISNGMDFQLYKTEVQKEIEKRLDRISNTCGLDREFIGEIWDKSLIDGAKSLKTWVVGDLAIKKCGLNYNDLEKELVLESLKNKIQHSGDR